MSLTRCRAVREAVAELAAECGPDETVVVFVTHGPVSDELLGILAERAAAVLSGPLPGTWERSHAELAARGLLGRRRRDRPRCPRRGVVRSCPITGPPAAVAASEALVIDP